MTWQELKEKAKQLFGGCCDCRDEVNSKGYIRIARNDNDLIFRQNGGVVIEFSIGKENLACLDICYHRDYDQMYQIMLALRD